MLTSLFNMRKSILKKTKNLTNTHSLSTTDVSPKPNSSKNDIKTPYKSSASQSSSYNVSRGRSCTKKHARQSSDSTSVERISHNSTKPSVHRPSSKSTKRGRQLEKIQVMAFTSILSPYFPRRVSVERPYDHPLSPTTRHFFL